MFSFQDETKNYGQNFIKSKISCLESKANFRKDFCTSYTNSHNSSTENVRRHIHGMHDIPSNTSSSSVLVALLCFPKGFLFNISSKI